MLAILSRLSIFFINNILRAFDKTKILLYKLSVRYLVVKPACVNAALHCLLYAPRLLDLEGLGGQSLPKIFLS